MTHKRDQKFLDKNNWKDIKRGWIYEAVVPYTAERPLDFFIPDPNDKAKGVISSGLGVFRAGDVHKAIIELKQRKVIVLSRDEICLDENIYDITVAPIYGIYNDTKTKSWYKKLVGDQHPFFTYLPDTITGRECLVDLTNIMSISKNMLLSDKRDVGQRITQIDEVLQYCLSLGIYKNKMVDIGEKLNNDVS